MEKQIAIIDSLNNLLNIVVVDEDLNPGISKEVVELSGGAGYIDLRIFPYPFDRMSVWDSDNKVWNAREE